MTRKTSHRTKELAGEYRTVWPEIRPEGKIPTKGFLPQDPNPPALPLYLFVDISTTLLCSNNYLD